MQQEEHTIDKVQLTDGRVVDVETESGANAFLQTGSESIACLSENLERMSKIYAKRRLNAKDKNDLLSLNSFIGSISESMSFANMSNKVRLSNFFNVLTDFVKARKGTGRALPSDKICLMITLIVCNAHHTSRRYFDNTWTTEKTLKKLEATGILEQFIRCVTVPQPCDVTVLFQMLDEFQSCVPFISKKVRPGQPCGDTIMAILDGRDGSRVERPNVVNKLKTIIRFGSSIGKFECDDAKRICRNCGKSDYPESLMKCGRCQKAYYCSTECQKADWKTHKTTCTPKTKKELLMSENIKQTVLAFCENQYVHIMVKMVKVCEQTGLSKKDMLVELNLTANENGIVPAMQDIPEFKIAPVKDYIEGSRPAEPNWFNKGSDCQMYESNIKIYLTNIKEKYSKVETDQILCLVKYEGGFTCFQVGMADPFTNKEVFSQEVVHAFKAYMNNDDEGPLSAVFEPGYLRKLKWEIDIHYTNYTANK